MEKGAELRNLPLNYDKLPILRGVCNQQVVGSNPTAGSFNLRLESLAVASHPLQAIGDFRFAFAEAAVDKLPSYD